jgi:hypothetical protein
MCRCRTVSSSTRRARWLLARKLKGLYTCAPPWLPLRFPPRPFQSKESRPGHGHHLQKPDERSSQHRIDARAQTNFRSFPLTHPPCDLIASRRPTASHGDEAAGGGEAVGAGGAPAAGQGDIGGRGGAGRLGRGAARPLQLHPRRRHAHARRPQEGSTLY